MIVEMDGYLIIEVGYEGIEHIIGLYPRNEDVLMMRALVDEAQRFWDRTSEAYPYPHPPKPEQYCIQHVDRYGSECACRECGFGREETWWY